MLIKLNSENIEKYSHLLYEYFSVLASEIPFYFPVDYETWYQCMFHDCTEEGTSLFRELETCLLFGNGVLNGFAQYGITSFAFGETGKDFGKHYAVIRNMHYTKDCKTASELINTAIEYFNSKDIKEINAFFHYFGMSCYARHGKLHSSMFHMEDLLTKNSFIKEHENVYFSLDLFCKNYEDFQEIDIEEQLPKRNNRNYKFIYNGTQIGYCSLLLLQNGISYMTDLEIFDEYRHQGLGFKSMNNLFGILQNMNYQKIDLDTIDSNFVAQNFYAKLRFVKKGITRSYVRFKEGN